MQLYNSLTQELFTLPEEWEKHGIRLFVCGPTVYDAPHIGHARTYIAFDALVRWLTHKGIDVFYLQNITDVDDKIITRAQERNITPQTLAREFERVYKERMRQLNISTVTRYARASDHIEDIISQITTLIEKGHAYTTDTGVYFDISTFPSYGKLSRQHSDNTQAGARVEIDSSKKNPHDFALWKFTQDDPCWESPWGKGRPGWHIEDTAITQHYFGVQYEMHGGASELKFPHHEAEIAQQEAASRKEPLVALWTHTGVLLVDDKKMSKSLGNFITVEDFLSNYSADVLRYMVLSSSYRSPIHYSSASADAAASAWNTITLFLSKLSFVVARAKNDAPQDIDIDHSMQVFTDALDNDFNTAKALAHIHSLIAEYEPSLYSLSSDNARTVFVHITQLLELLGFSEFPPLSYRLPFRVGRLAKKRDRARSNQQFTHSDALREKIERLGYKVEDTQLGSFVYKHTKQ